MINHTQARKGLRVVQYEEHKIIKNPFHGRILKVDDLSYHYFVVWVQLDPEFAKEEEFASMSPKDGIIPCFPWQISKEE